LISVRLTQSVFLFIYFESTLKYKVKTNFRTVQEYFKKKLQQDEQAEKTKNRLCAETGFLIDIYKFPGYDDGLRFLNGIYRKQDIFP